MKLRKRKQQPDRRSREDFESRLMESAYEALDLLNREDAYRDGDGKEWLPLGAGADIDRGTAPFQNNEQLRLIRQRARITALKNPYAKNLLNSICSFTIGKGHKYTATVKQSVLEEDRPAAKKLATRVQLWLNKLLKINKWSRRQRQVVRRYHRDGETFIRVVPDGRGFAYFRFIEPSAVYTPPTAPAGVEFSFGVITDPEDPETVEGYYVNEEEIDAAEIQHRKANVDSSSRRGLSTLFTIREHLERALKLLRNMSITVANQTAISSIRHHKATKAGVQSFAARAATGSRRTLEGGDQRTTTWPAGSTIDLADGKTRFEFPAGGLNAASPVQVLAAELRAVASSMSWPEFMIGSDSSNASYSSTMVAENPAVKSIESEQAEHIEDDLELIWSAVDIAVEADRLPPEVLAWIEIEVESPIIVSRDRKTDAEVDQILHDMRVKSPQSIASGNGLDYAQEQSNFAEADDNALDDGGLDGPITPGVVADGDVAKTALNGAQVTALAALLQQAAAGLIPRESIEPMILAAFPGLDVEQVRAITAPLEGFVAAAPPSGGPKLEGGKRLKLRRRRNGAA